MCINYQKTTINNDQNTYFTKLCSLCSNKFVSTFLLNFSDLPNTMECHTPKLTKAYIILNFELNYGFFKAVYQIFSEASFNLSIKIAGKFFTDKTDIRHRIDYTRIVSIFFLNQCCCSLTYYGLAIMALLNHAPANFTHYINTVIVRYLRVIRTQVTSVELDARHDFRVLYCKFLFAFSGAFSNK